MALKQDDTLSNGRHRTIRPPGRGGFVYAAQDTFLEKRVATKKEPIPALYVRRAGLRPPEPGQIVSITPAARSSQPLHSGLTGWHGSESPGLDSQPDRRVDARESCPTRNRFP